MILPTHTFQNSQRFLLVKKNKTRFNFFCKFLTWSIVDTEYLAVQSNYSCILLEPLSSIAMYIPMTASLVVVSGVVKMQSVPALYYPSPLQLQSGVLCSGGCLDSAGPLVGGYIPMCATIPINMTPSGFWIS